MAYQIRLSYLSCSIYEQDFLRLISEKCFYAMGKLTVQHIIFLLFKRKNKYFSLFEQVIGTFSIKTVRKIGTFSIEIACRIGTFSILRIQTPC